MPQQTVSVGYCLGNALDFDCDVLAVKYAQAGYGLDRAVTAALVSAGADRAALQPAEGEHILVPSQAAVRARSVLILGTPALRSFGYRNVSEFASRALEVLLLEAPQTTSVALTLHGPNFGLDPLECARMMFEGIAYAIQSAEFPPGLRTVCVVEKDADRLEVLHAALRGYGGHAEPLPTTGGAAVAIAIQAKAPRRVRSTFTYSDEPDTDQRSVFVAMPFDKKMRTVWKYGIYQPVHAAGLNCERMDEVHFTGDILERMRKLIERAELVIADITGNNPNVFLELGYAWGVNRPTLLLVQRDEAAGVAPDLPFDVRTQRCLMYEDAVDLEEKLTAALQGLNLARGA